MNQLSESKGDSFTDLTHLEEEKLAAGRIGRARPAARCPVFWGLTLISKQLLQGVASMARSLSQYSSANISFLRNGTPPAGVCQSLLLFCQQNPPYLTGGSCLLPACNFCPVIFPSFASQPKRETGRMKPLSKSCAFTNPASHSLICLETNKLEQHREAKQRSSKEQD